MYTYKVLRIIHILQTVIGILFAVFIAYVALENFELKKELAYGRFFLSITLFIFSLSHIHLTQTKKIETFKVFSFVPIYILFGLTFSLYWSGYIKNWAPATDAGALTENIIGLLLVSFIFSLGVISVVFKRNQKET